MNLRKKRFSDISIDDALAYFMPRISERRLQRLTETLQLRSRYVVPVMEDMFQEQNAGAVVRTAECCGFQEVGIIERNNAYKMASGIAKGAQKWVDTSIFDARFDAPLNSVVDHYRAAGYRLVGACPHSDGHQPETLPIDKPLAVFFGAEKMGLHPQLREQMDAFVAIPMRGFTESYNVSVSAAIVLQQIRQRLEDSGQPFLLNDEERKHVLLEWIIHSIPRGAESFAFWNSKQFQK